MPRPVKPCPKCREVRRMTIHHVLPRRHFGRKGNNFTFMLCRNCHNALELLIPFERIAKHRYVEILLRFMEDT